MLHNPTTEKQRDLSFWFDHYNQVAPEIYKAFKQFGIKTQSRNGPVLRLPGVTTITVNSPDKRVNFCRIRDANPFFHLVEAMAMLANYNSVQLLSYFASNMLSYSDDGHTYNAFYGTRVKHRFGCQLMKCVDMLRADPDSRQAVVDLHNSDDLWKQTKDRACNLMMVFSIVENKLEMTTFNRSNDAIWGGVTGANVVHFPFFQEYVADLLGLPMGPWTHVSNNLHVYLGNPKFSQLIEAGKEFSRYQYFALNESTLGLPFAENRVVQHSGEFILPRKLNADQFTYNLLNIVLKQLDAAIIGQNADVFKFETRKVSETAKNSFVYNTFIPAMQVFLLHKGKQYTDARLKTFSIDAPDWRVACLDWLERRYEKTNTQEGV